MADYDLRNRKSGKPIIYTDYVSVNNNFNNNKMNTKHGADYENIAFVNKKGAKNKNNRMFGNRGNTMHVDFVLINKNINANRKKN